MAETGPGSQMAFSSTKSSMMMPPSHQASNTAWSVLQAVPTALTKVVVVKMELGVCGGAVRTLSVEYLCTNEPSYHWRNQAYRFHTPSCRRCSMTKQQWPCCPSARNHR